ncbi:Glycosyl hydrolase family 65, N-terminal domain [Micromonospora pallida]|uniref:Glycosyl hydrolase family 65, N-terminal domain n=1 Tax=Micromonospora pallida TaxID=145854 RepID=A0A1C6T8Z7_9ACTN|nr:hypothetical protein [Micromonospora pallida]SCL38003.1 Glycosyl hydrolase family 65, N-terminal domain [Micromonospora pallida]
MPDTTVSDHQPGHDHRPAGRTTGHDHQPADHPAGDDGWRIRRTEADADRLGETESVFALSNGWLGWRGNLDEGEPYGMPGSYLNGFYERRGLSYPEDGYAFPQFSDTVVSAPNAALIRLWVDGEPLDVRTGTLRRHERVLDLRAGLVERHTEWVSPGGHAVRVRSIRLVSLARRPVAAVRWEVEPLDGPVEVRVCSDLVANQRVPERSDDPRAATVLDEPLAAEYRRADGPDGVLVHRTERSGQRVAVAVAHLVEAPDTTATDTGCQADRFRLALSGPLRPGQRLRLTKFAAYECTRTDAAADPTAAAADGSARTVDRAVDAPTAEAAESPADLADQAARAAAEARTVGWDALVTEQRASSTRPGRRPTDVATLRRQVVAGDPSYRFLMSRGPLQPPGAADQAYGLFAYAARRAASPVSLGSSVPQPELK